MQISGRVFVVTGAGSGMGRQIALQLLQRWGRVAAVDLSAERLEQTRQLAGADADRMSVHTVNVTDRDAVGRLPEQIMQAQGQIDALLNVAGIIQRFARFTDVDRSEVDRVLSVNFFGVVNTVHAFLPVLLTRPEAVLLNVSSMGSFIPVPGQTIYGASKAAVKLFTEGLHAELRDSQVHVTTVFPGAVATSITENSGVDAPAVAGANENAANPKMLSAAAAAHIIIEKGVVKNRYRVLVGRDATFMDAFTRLLPERAMIMIADQMSTLLQHTPAAQSAPAPAPQTVRS